MRTRLRPVIAGLAAFLWGSMAAAQGESLEYAVKATYLYKFAPFVEWPDGALSPSGPLVLCIVGRDPFGDIVDRAVAGQEPAQRPVEIRRLRTAGRDDGCHVMYVGGSIAQSVNDALRAVSGIPVLTVTDSALGSRARGIIHFVVSDNRVRFSIDDYAAAVNGLAISSKLLSLATSVRSRSE